MIGKIKCALYGIKLNSQNFILSHIGNTLLKTIPDINQTLLQFIGVMKLVELLLRFSPSVSSLTQVIS